MAVETKRGCGYRKVGGLYLVSSALSEHCHLLPIDLKVCPTCNAGFKPSRGHTWLKLSALIREYRMESYGRLVYAACDRQGEPERVRHCDHCPVCGSINQKEKQLLLWLGGSFYNRSSFCAEAAQLGVSRRIAALPVGFKAGETLVLMAERAEEPEQEAGLCGRIFAAFIPRRVEKLLWASEATPEVLEKLEKRGITPVIIPDGDADHDPANRNKGTRKGQQWPMPI